MRLPGIDALRLFAALSVVAFHYLFRGPVSGWVQSVQFPLLEGPARYGLLGVDLFFIISGFVIAWSAQDRSATDFIRARLLRLWPGFLVCMSVSAVVLAAAGNPLFPSSMAMWLANIIFMPQILGQPFVDGAYWSIVLEIIFYGWVAVLLWSGLWPRYFAVIGCAWLAVSVLNHTALHLKVLERLVLTGYSGEFLGGMILYRIHAGRSERADAPLVVASVAVAVWLGIVKTERELRELFHTTSDPMVVAVIVLSAFYLVSWACRTRVPPRLATWVTLAGAITYPLYLLHQNIGFVLFDLLVPAGVPPAIALLLITSGVVATATGVAVWLEPAGRRLLGRVWPAAAARAVARASVLPADGTALRQAGSRP